MGAPEPTKTRGCSCHNAEYRTYALADLTRVVVDGEERYFCPAGVEAACRVYFNLLALKRNLR